MQLQYCHAMQKWDDRLPCCPYAIHIACHNTFMQPDNTARIGKWCAEIMAGHEIYVFVLLTVPSVCITHKIIYAHLNPCRKITMAICNHQTDCHWTLSVMQWSTRCGKSGMSFISCSVPGLILFYFTTHWKWNVLTINIFHKITLNKIAFIYRSVS